jgi:hypothetical protein
MLNPMKNERLEKLSINVIQSVDRMRCTSFGAAATWASR